MPFPDQSCPLVRRVTRLHGTLPSPSPTRPVFIRRPGCLERLKYPPRPPSLFSVRPSSPSNELTMPHPFSRYRLRLFWDFVRIVLVPSLFFAAIICSRGVLCWIAPFAWLAFLVVSAFARLQYHAYKLRAEAHRRGGRLPPQVVGKWPGNIDILIKLGIAARTRYPGSFYLALFEEYKSTTLNLRLLWSDLVRLSFPPTQFDSKKKGKITDYMRLNGGCRSLPWTRSTKSTSSPPASASFGGAGGKRSACGFLFPPLRPPQ